jgi:hypothetical protein
MKVGRKFTVVAAVAAGLLVTSLANVLSDPASAAAPPIATAVAPPTTTVVTFLSTVPPVAGQVTAVANLPAAARAQIQAANHQIVTPMTATPDGYTVRGGNKINNYVYKSDDVYAYEEYCGVLNCTLHQSIRTTFKETLNGNNSNVWVITFFSVHYSGPTGYIFEGGYGCGHDVAGAGDNICSDVSPYAAPGWGPTPLSVNASNSVGFTFGTGEGLKLFPYAKFHIYFADGVAVQDNGSEGIKYRGWDACTSATNNVLCATAKS